MDIKERFIQFIEYKRLSKRKFQENIGVSNSYIQNISTKPICRLYFNTANKAIGIFNEDKKETKHKIEKLDDIYNHQEELINSIKKYTEQ